MIQVGDFRNFKLYEGLTFDNLETQSWIFKLKFRNFYIKHAGIGDLLLGIGLGIDDLYDYSTGIEDLFINQDSTLNLDLRIGYSNNRRSIGAGFWNFSGNLNYDNWFSVYSQFSMNKNSNFAYLFGLKSKFKLWEKIEIKTSLEYRNYSAGFNFGYTNTVFYRDPEKIASFTNSTNNVFIPLDYYERNFNQWAVFTEYQNVDINGLNILSTIKYELSNKIYLDLMIDFNWINTENENILFPFFKFGLGVIPAKSAEVSLEITNRVLNLDKNFPSFYSSNNPYLLLRFYKPLKFVRENDRQHHQI